ncbi:MAG: hypothetical protein IJS07_06600 [Bacteroidales bacterium]|nr:hypothetical protein [Bacteroidales bacterium]
MKKALFISFNQAYGEDVTSLLERHGQRGFTRWDEVSGRGSENGEPHFGNHAWPVMNIAVLTFVDADKAPAILEDLRALDAASPELGLRTFSWNTD